MKDQVEKGSGGRNRAKTKSKRAHDPLQPLNLTWTLHELPSSQHRAGLAGLALCVRFLDGKAKVPDACKVAFDADCLTLTVSRAGMQSLFDDIYDAGLEETFSKAKWAGTDPKRVQEVEVKDEASGKLKREKRFVYDRVVPSGQLVAEWDQGTQLSDKLWLKLWRDLVWSTLRGVPAQREPFNARAFKRAIDDGGEAWDELAADPNATVELASTHALGVQAKSAENVEFQDLARFRFLLHFWPCVAAIYVPAVLQRDGKRDFVGHALAIPDVARLDHFVDAWEYVVRSRSSEATAYLPKEAVIDLAAEAALDVVRRTEEVVASRQGASLTASVVHAVDVFHIEKEGNNVRLRSTSRVAADRLMVDEYARVRRANYWSALFRRQRIANVLHGKSWWHGFGKLCATSPQELTMNHSTFRHDCRQAFKETEMKEGSLDDEQSLESLIYRLVQSYVLGKTQRKYDLNWQNAGGDPERETDYREKREKIAREAFLAVRSRTGADFVAYFSSTLCSVPQRSGEAKYVEIARALMNPDSTEKVRCLTLMALSAVA